MNAFHVARAIVITLLGVCPVSAGPVLGFIDNMDNSVTLQVTTNLTGSMGAEITVDATMALTGAVIADPVVFDTPITGSNPLTGTSSVGLYLDQLATGDLFVSYGSDVVSPSTYNLLTISFNDPGSMLASGLVAQGETLFTGLTASINMTSADLDGDGDVDGRDFLEWQREDGSASGLIAWEDQFGTGPALGAVAFVPEPAGGLLLTIGLVLVQVCRERSVVLVGIADRS